MTSSVETRTCPLPLMAAYISLSQHSCFQYYSKFPYFCSTQATTMEKALTALQRIRNLVQRTAASSPFQEDLPPPSNGGLLFHRHLTSPPGNPPPKYAQFCISSSGNGASVERYTMSKIEQSYFLTRDRIIMMAILLG